MRLCQWSGGQMVATDREMSVSLEKKLFPWVPANLMDSSCRLVRSRNTGR